MIKNIIFDWSGTLSNITTQYMQICDEIFTKMGIEKISLEELRKNYTLPYMKFWNKYLPDMSHAEQKVLYEEAILKTKRPELYNGVKQAIQELNALGVKLFVVSSDLYVTLTPEIKASGFEELFLEVIGDVHEKEHSLKEVVKKHKLKPDETLYVGDTSGDVEAGKAAGIKTAGISWGLQCEEKLALSKPDFLIKKIDELVEIAKNPNI